MSDSFLGEIRIFSFQFAPRDWALCNGQLLPINQNQALFSLCGTQYGGDGQTTFALPNLQGKTPIHVGNGHAIGQTGGEQAHTLSISEIPTHTHPANASASVGNTVVPTGHIPASPLNLSYHPAGSGLTSLHPSTLAPNSGSTQAHPNMQPYLTLNFCIAVIGIFPSRT